MTRAAIDNLFCALRQRLRPEDVAAIIADDVPKTFQASKLHALFASAKVAAARWSYMSRSFFKAVGAESYRKGGTYLFPDLKFPNDANDVDGFREYLREANALIQRQPGEDFKDGRMNRGERARVALQYNRYQYNKRFRYLCRLEEKVVTLDKTNDVELLTMLANSRLAAFIDADDFARDYATACYTAYLGAKLSMRSLFTCGPQERARDELSETMYACLKRNSNATAWKVVACVDPRPEVCAKLTDAEKIWLLDTYAMAMKKAARILALVAKGIVLRKETMVVKRGDDSTTWNIAAGAWNKARDGWISVVQALGADDIFNDVLPGKVMRLMAADVVRWHSAVGGKIEPNTAVWAKLPYPWEVLDGKAKCTRGDIEEACRAVGMDPQKAGWTAPICTFKIAPFKPTPDSVYGVVVNDPHLASYLKRLGVFSGRSVKDPMNMDTMFDVMQVRSDHYDAEMKRHGIVPVKEEQ